MGKMLQRDSAKILWLLLLFWSSSFGIVKASESQPSADLPIPLEGSSVQSFNTHEWVFKKQSEIDLNGDGAPDILAASSQGWGNPYLLLLKGKDGKYHRIRADCLLSSRGLSTMLGGSVEATIDKGVLVVSRSSGSSYVDTTTWRFRYDPGTQRFALIGKDTEESHRTSPQLEGELSSVNYLTGEKKVEKYYYKKGQRIVTSTRSSHVAKIKKFIEDVDHELADECN